MARQNRKKRDNRRDQSEFEERVVSIDRTSKVHKGGRRFGFRACVVLGDGAGRVGYGIGKARDVPEAIRKGVEGAKKNMISVPLLEHTIPHTIEVEESAARVLLRPASPGTGVIAGGGVRAVVEAAGVKNILTKSLGSDNTINVVRATFAALEKLQDLETVAANRGKTLAQIAPPWYKVEEATHGG